MIHASYEFHARQQQVLTPRLQQSVKLLHMSTLDFNREVAQALSENPFLDEDEHDQAPDPAQTRDNGHVASDALDTAPSDNSLATNDASTSEGEPSSLAKMEYNERPDYSGDYPNSRPATDSDVGQWARQEQRLQDALLADLSGYRLTQRDLALITFIVDALDDDGYLRTPLADLATALQFDPPIRDEEWTTALRLIQQASIPGLAARDLTECLTLQLAALEPCVPGRELAITIASTQLERLARCEYAWLAKTLEQPEHDIKQACDLIRRLDPKPGRRFARIDPTSYIVPDTFVRRVGKVWTAVPNHASIPRVRLHSGYMQLFREASNTNHAPVAQALQEARWLMRSIDQRATTIQRVAAAIVARQQTFFDYGEVALRPLMLSEIAEELGVHESTVSRATSNKYLATARGVYEFKHFFSRELATQSGGTCSSAAVRALIQEMIDEENPREPMSDVTLTKKLAREGIVVARRTVSKYRTQLKTPPAEMRRAL